MIGRTNWVILGIAAAAGALGAAVVLPMVGAHQQALKEQPRVQSLVETVVAGEINTRVSRGRYSAIAFGSSETGIALGSSDRAAILDYAVEARQIADDRFRIQA